MSDISQKHSWMSDRKGDSSDTRIDCALGVELKKIRVKNEMKLMDMSSAMGMTPAQLSNYEHNIGALNNPVHATAIDRWCVDSYNILSDSAIILSQKSVITDLSKVKAMLAGWRNCDLDNKGGEL